ncbi:MAG: histidine triad nucleotide-binding protein [Planctomycetes bacterium]|nr:histidine triad nucleotide-binding protein [Planctomycetota bacterium]
MAPEETLFAKIIRKEIPADVVYEDDLALAFRDLAPQAPVHVLVIPKEPIANVGVAEDAHRDLLGHLMLVAGKVAVQEGVADAFRVVTNSGEGAGQSVFHLHLHVLGGRPFSWPPG